MELSAFAKVVILLSSCASTIANSTTLYEAEDSEYDASLSVIEEASASNGQYLEMQDQGELYINVPSNKEGEAEITVRYRSLWGDKTQTILVNQIASDLHFPAAKSWREARQNITLASGNNKIALAASWGWIDIDSITVTVDGQPAGTRHEFESAELSDDLTTINEADASEGQYVAMQTSGEAKFTVKALKSGKQSLLIRYRSPYGDKQQNLTVNNTTTDLLQFTQTNDWQLLKSELDLKEGLNTIELGANWGWVDLDYIEVDSNAQDPSAPKGEVLFTVDGKGYSNNKGEIFVGQDTDNRHHFAKINPYNGKLEWVYKGREGYQVRNDFDKDGDVYLTEIKGDIIALDRINGKPKWKLDASATGLRFVKQIGTYLYFVSSKQLVAVNKNSGNINWSLSPHRISTGIKYLGEDFIVTQGQLSSADLPWGYLVIDSKNGKVIRTFAKQGQLSLRVFADSSGIYIKEGDRLSKQDWYSGITLWEKHYPNETSSQITKTDEGLFYANNWRLSEFDPDGQESWGLSGNNGLPTIFGNKHIELTQNSTEKNNEREFVFYNQSRDEYWRTPIRECGEISSLEEGLRSDIYLVNRSCGISRVDTNYGGISWKLSPSLYPFNFVKASDDYFVYLTSTESSYDKPPAGKLIVINKDSGKLYYEKNKFYVNDFLHVGDYIVANTLSQNGGQAQVVGLAP